MNPMETMQSQVVQSKLVGQFIPADAPSAVLASANLTSNEVLAMAAYLFDGEDQRIIGERIGIGRSAVNQMIRRGCAKLLAVGITVPLPARRGHPRRAVKSIDPEILSQVQLVKVGGILATRF